jgi:hypothetical protein
MRSTGARAFGARRWLTLRDWRQRAANPALLFDPFVWFLLALMVVSGPLLFLAYQVERPMVVDIGGAHETPFIANFHNKAGPDEEGASYRWTHATSFVRLAGIGGERPRQVTLRLRSGRPDTAEWPVSVVVNSVDVAQVRVGPDWQTFRVAVDGAAAAPHGVLIELRTRAAPLPGTRGPEVGVQLDQVRVEAAGSGATVPAWDTLVLAVVVVAQVALVALRVLALVRPRAAGNRPWAIAGGAIGLLVLLGLMALERPYTAAYLPRLIGFGLGILAILSSAGLLRRLGERLGLNVTQQEAGALCSIVALGVAVKLGGLLYPDTVVVDLPWHARWERVLLQGDFASLYFPSALSSGPREWGQNVLIPKSPLYYLAMAPFTFLPLDIGTALKLAAGLLDVAIALLVYVIPKRMGWGTAGVVAALLYTVTPLSYLLLSFGSYPTLFAQFLSLLAFITLLCADERLARPPIFILFVTLLALSLLAYPVVAVFNVCVLGLFGLSRWWLVRGREGSRQASLILGGTILAAVLAFAIYYGQYLWITLRSIETIGDQQPRAQEALEGGLLGQPGHIATVALQNLLIGRLFVILALAILGGVLLQRGVLGGEWRRGWHFLVCWVAILPLFVIVDAYVELLLKPLFYTMAPLAILGGIGVTWLWRQGQLWRVVAVSACAIIAAQAWLLWFERIANTGQIAR